MAACDAASKVVFIHGEAINQARASSGKSARRAGRSSRRRYRHSLPRALLPRRRRNQERIYLFIDDSFFLTLRTPSSSCSSCAPSVTYPSSPLRRPVRRLRPRMMMVSDASIIDAEQLAFTRGEVRGLSASPCPRHQRRPRRHRLRKLSWQCRHDEVCRPTPHPGEVCLISPAALTNLVAHAHIIGSGRS